MRSMPKNQHSTYMAMQVPATSTKPRRGRTAAHKPRRANTAINAMAPTRKRQKEIFSGVKSWRAMSTFTMSAPVPHKKPAPQAASRPRRAALGG